jgi:hypothetical protein
VTLLALAVLGLLAVGTQSRLVRLHAARLVRPGRVLARLAPVATVAGVGALVAIGLARWASGPRDADPDLSYSFLEHMDEASASLVRGSEVVACDREGSKLRCPGPDWAWVGPATVTAGVLDRRCIWAHPHASRDLRIELPAVPLGARLVGRHGLGDFAATQTPEGTAVRLRVAVQGGPSQVFTADNEQGFRRWELDTSALAGQRRDVVLTVSTVDAFRRDYCFTAGVAAGP